MPDSRRTDTLNGLVLPPMPQALQTIRAERARPEPDVERIAAAIGSDPALSAEVLRLVNSPAFGLRRQIGSIPNAIMLLGLANVVNLVCSVALRASMSGLANMSLDRFWDTASDVALVSARVAKEYTGFPGDVAYTLGLFHDCGIPLLMAAHSDYGALIKAKVNAGWRITDAEFHHFNMHHATLGHHVARHWHLPQEIAQAILHHHADFGALAGSGVAEEVRTLVAVLKIGEYVSAEFRAVAFMREENHSEWERVSEQVLDHLAMGDLEFADLRDSMLEMLGQR